MVNVQPHGDEHPPAEGAQVPDEDEDEIEDEDDGAEMVTAELAMGTVDTPAQFDAMVADRLIGASDPDLLGEVRDELEEEDFVGQRVNLSQFDEQIDDEFGEVPDDDDEADTIDPEEELEQRRVAECNEQAHQYICGWLSYEFANTHPELGTPTGRMSSRFEIQPWLEKVSRGGLRNPDQGFVDQVRLWDSEFDKYHGGPFNISYEKNVIENFVRVLVEKFPQWDVAILKKYSTFRLFCRIKYLERIRKAENKERLESNRARRKLRQYVPDT